MLSLALSTPGPERTRVSLALEDRLAITELVSLHGHLVDNGSLDRLEELFTAGVVYDLTDFGQEPLSGVVAIREAAWALGAANPVAHHVTNVVVTASADGRVHVRSKGLGIKADGSCSSVSYAEERHRVGTEHVPPGPRTLKRSVCPQPPALTSTSHRTGLFWDRTPRGASPSTCPTPGTARRRVLSPTASG
ncbi:nuclear transport factor 2 family protein [Streptomyces sviceus]|uniref:nuclear transport factor 2 family protein n=1 Tax=Streptomyces sviceus TaxID=285530 RepID=UPI00332B5518